MKTYYFKKTDGRVIYADYRKKTLWMKELEEKEKEVIRGEGWKIIGFRKKTTKNISRFFAKNKIATL